MDCDSSSPHPLAERQNANIFASAPSLPVASSSPSTDMVDEDDTGSFRLYEWSLDEGASQNEGSLETPNEEELPQGSEAAAALMKGILRDEDLDFDGYLAGHRIGSSSSNTFDNAHTHEESLVPEQSSVDHRPLSPLGLQTTTSPHYPTAPSHSGLEDANTSDPFSGIDISEIFDFDVYSANHFSSMKFADSEESRVTTTDFPAEYTPPLLVYPWSYSPEVGPQPHFSFEHADAAPARKAFLADEFVPSTPVLSSSQGTPLSVGPVLGPLSSGLGYPNSDANLAPQESTSRSSTRKTSKKRAPSDAFSDEDDTYLAATRSSSFVNPALSDGDSEDDDDKSESDHDAGDDDDDDGDEYVPEPSSSKAAPAAKKARTTRSGNALEKNGKAKQSTLEDSESEAEREAPRKSKLELILWLIELFEHPTKFDHTECRICDKKDDVMRRHVEAMHTIPLGKLFIGAKKWVKKYCSKDKFHIFEAERHLLYACLIIPWAQSDDSLKGEVARFRNLYSSWIPSTSRDHTPLPPPNFDFAHPRWAGLRKLAMRHGSEIGWVSECTKREPFNRLDSLRRHQKKCKKGCKK